INGGEA
ncbi:hypothetical protein CP061683_0684C, partial [Chlamydia psittaci 06-1683]